ncbi:MAG: electron transporter RnfD, partial [Spirochaetes bacterium]
LFAGGLMLGALFMATDMVTSPLTRKGRIVFGIGCGFLTFVIRRYGNLPEGVSLAIIFMNILVPLINRFTKIKRYGTAS